MPLARGPGGPGTCVLPKTTQSPPSASASLQPYKGLKHLIRACAQVVQHVANFRCLIIGEGADAPSWRILISELGLSDTIRLLGASPRREVARMLGGADLFVLPSVVAPSGQMDGIPVALMEAMASRLPVVSTRLSGIPELVDDGESGLSVHPEASRTGRGNHHSVWRRRTPLPHGQEGQGARRGRLRVGRQCREVAGIVCTDDRRRR